MLTSLWVALTARLQVVYDLLVEALIFLTESGYIPDRVLRLGIRSLLGQRIAQIPPHFQDQVAHVQRFVTELKSMPVAINTPDANAQHYEVPTEYYLLCLGHHLKYSSCLYQRPHDTLNHAEANMLALYCQRAELSDGQDILELGCGWGSLSLYLAARYPSSRVTAVSNSKTQRAFIMGLAGQRKLANLQVITANMVDFTTEQRFDRIVSIEMFEHMKNYQELLRRCASWLRPGGTLFVHIFVHKTSPYHFEVQNAGDWMSKYFFTGGTMPSMDLLLHFQEHLVLNNMWYIDGTHYSRTLEAWLVKHDAKRHEVMRIFEGTYGKAMAIRWFNRWRMFYVACSELFNYRGGEEWGIGHYLFRKPLAGAAAAGGDAARVKA